MSWDSVPESSGLNPHSPLTEEVTGHGKEDTKEGAAFWGAFHPGSWSSSHRPGKMSHPGMYSNTGIGAFFRRANGRSDLNAWGAVSVLSLDS